MLCVGGYCESFSTLTVRSDYQSMATSYAFSELALLCTCIYVVSLPMFSYILSTLLSSLMSLA